MRLRAQWALAGQAVSGEGKTTADGIGKRLVQIARQGAEGPERRLSRLHAVWALGQMLRNHLQHVPAPENGLPAPDADGLALLTDEDSEVRAQMIGILGDAPARFSKEMVKAIAPLLADTEPRVRFAAAIALGKRGDGSSAPALAAMLRENADKDEFLRHAAVFALAADSNQPALEAAAHDESRSVRLGALLAERRRADPAIAQFLADKDVLLAKEAARAINDVPIVAAYEQLAAQLGNAPEGLAKDAPFMIRAINANFRAGGPAQAEALAKFAASEASESLRAEALVLLGQWAQPAARDRVVGIFRPLPPRDAAPAIAALRGVLPQLLAVKSEKLALSTIDALAALGAKDAGPALLETISNKERSPKVRALALHTLGGLGDPSLAEAVKLAIVDKDAALRVEARAMLGKLDPNEAAAQLASAFTDAANPEKKAILKALADLKSPAADQALAALLDGLAANKVPAEVQLELLEAAAKRNAPEVKTKFAAYQDNLPKGDVLAAFAPTLVGGDKAEGERIFKEHAVAQCFRCHKVGGAGGDAGPDLTGIGAKKDRKYILESILNPNAQIAEGFQSVLVTLNNGDMQMGIPKAETAEELTLQPPVPGVPPVKVKKADVKARENAPSGMPPGFDKLLTKREIRDLVEYVANLK